MRVMVIVPSNHDSEAGVPPSRESLAKMLKFNEELVKAGVILAMGGLAPTSMAKRVRFDGAQRTVVDGPFAETKELIAGFWIWQVKSMEEAVEWLKRAPFDGDVAVTIRQVMGPEDFGWDVTPEMRERGASLREELAKQHRSS